MRLALVLLILTASSLLGQIDEFEPTVELEGPSFGTVRGRIVDEAGAPVAKAMVQVVGAGPAAGNKTKTDSAGKFVLPRLPAGPVELQVKAEGLATGTARFNVDDGADTALEMTLAIDEPARIQDWLVEGNRSLEQGDTEHARERFEQALTVVFGTGSAEIARAVARTYYLEGRLDDAARTLQRALFSAPQDEETRQLYLALLEGQGRRAEAEGWLAEFDRGQGRAALAGLDERPLLDLSGRPTGRFQTTLKASSPLSKASLISQRLGRYAGSSDTWDPSRATFEVYVPAADAPAGGYGVVVWISPTPLGAVTDREILPELDRRGLIWIGANQSGNDRPVIDRLRLALDAATAVASAYPVDAGRVWAAGYSGGARMASALAFHFSEVFRGALVYMGSDYYQTMPDPHQPGISWPAQFDPPAPEILARLKSECRLTLVTGEYDFNRFQTRVNFAAMQKEGFRRVRYFELPDIGHYYGLRAYAFAQALALLEGETRAAPQ
jgi:hypothetical protein